MLQQRVTTAVILIGVFLLALFAAPYSVFTGLMFLVFLIGAYEWSHMLQKAYRCSGAVKWLATAFFAVLMAVSLWMNLHINLSAFSFPILISVMCAACLVVCYPKKLTFWHDQPLMHLAFGVLTLLPSFLAILGLQAQSTEEQPHLGQTLILAVVLVTVTADTGAYFVGKKWGKTKMIPNVSPNKTLEGLLGGIALTCLCFMLYWSQLGFEFAKGVLICTATVLASVLGDLSESMFKRHAKIKDSGHILPGHGGVLDRIDSLTFALPVFTALMFILGV